MKFSELSFCNSKGLFELWENSNGLCRKVPELTQQIFSFCKKEMRRSQNQLRDSQDIFEFYSFFSSFASIRQSLRLEA